MRSWIVLLGVSCGGARPPPATTSLTPADQPAPVLTTTQPATPDAVNPDAERPLPPHRRFPVAWHSATAGNDTPAGHAIAFRPDGSLAVLGQGAAERWAGTPTKKLAKLYPHFVASLDASGKPEWVRTIDVGNGWTNGVASGPDGSVLITGAFEKTLKIAGKPVATSAGDNDVFVARFERDGTLAWAVRAGGAEFDLAHGIAVAEDGTSYVTGSISGDGTFGRLTAKHIGDRDAFLARFDPKGVAQWVSVGGGMASDSGMAVTLTKRAVCVTGEFSGVVTFQAVTLPMPKPEPNKVANPSNVFVVCHGLSGDVVWGERLGTHTSFDRGWDIAGLSDGSVVVTGDHSKQTFVARYAPGGKLLWQRQAIGDATARGVIALPGDEVLVATYLVAGELELAGHRQRMTVRARGADTVLAHYTADGELLAAGQIAGDKGRTGDDRDGDEIELARMAVSSTGRVAGTGRVWGKAVFEAGDLLMPTKDSVTGPSGHDLIVVMLDPLVPAP